MTDAHDLRQLKDLVVYASGIYSTMSGEACETWRPCDDTRGLLSQMSNILRGIHDLAESGHKMADACAELIVRAEKAERTLSLCANGQKEI